jgi:hypothetical protein
MIFNLMGFPKFRRFAAGDGYDTWEASLRNNGFPSARVHDYNDLIYEMDDIEYTWFVLRWS